MLLPESTNRPLPVLMMPPGPEPSAIAPEIVAKSPVENGLSSTWIVRTAPLRLMPFWISVSYWAELELRIIVPDDPLRAVCSPVDGAGRRRRG